MDYVNVTGLKVKASRGRVNKGISSFIRRNLNEIPNGGALAISALAKAVRTEFPHINQNQSYVRVNMVLKRLSAFGRYENDEGKTFIARNAAPVTETEDEKSEEPVTEGAELTLEEQEELNQ